MFVRGGYAYYAAHSAGGLRIVDISDPANPVEVGAYDTPGDALDVFVQGDYAYVADDSNGGLQILDVSDPANPVFAGAFPGNGSLQSRSVHVRNDVAYVVDVNDGGTLLMIDVSDPSASNVSSTYRSDTAAPNDVAVLGNIVFVADQYEGLVLFDVTGPSAPQKLSSLDLTGSAVGVAVRGATAFVVNTSGGLEAIDVTDPLVPTSISVAPMGVGNGSGALLLGSYAIVSNADALVRIVDVSNPAAPALAGDIDFSAGIRGLVVEGTLAYAATDAPFSLAIATIADPSNPAVLASHPRATAPYSIAVRDWIMCAADIGGFHVFDLTTPANLVEIGSMPVDVSGSNQIALDGDLAYVSGSVFRVLDITDLANLIEIANTQSSVIYDLGRTAFSNFAYSVQVNNGLTVLAVPPPPPDLDALPRFVDADSLTVSGTARPGSFVTIGGGEEPRFQQLAAGATAFSIEVPLKQESVNTLSVTTMNEFGLVSLPAIHVLVEGAAFPATVQGVTALALTPGSATVALNDQLAFTCVATFADSSLGNVTQFLDVFDPSGNQRGWSVTNGEVITGGGLYVNTKAGAAQVQATVRQGASLGGTVNSNGVTVGDAP